MKQRLHWRMIVLMFGLMWAVQGLGPDRSLALLKASEFEAGAINKGVKIVEVRPWQYVTAVRLADGHLKLIAWRMDLGANEKKLVRQGDHKAGRIAEDGIALYSRGDGQVFTAVRLRNDRLKLIQWQVSTSGQITRHSDIYAGDMDEVNGALDYDVVSHVGLTGVPPQKYAVIGGAVSIYQDLIVAARLKDNGNLKLYTFRSVTTGGTPQPLRQSDSYTAGAVHSSTFNRDIAISWAGERYVATAVRLTSEKLKMIGWSVDPSGQITREGSWRAGRIQGVSLTQGPKGELTTACRLLDGSLKLIGWSMENGNPVRQDDLKLNEWVTQVVALPTEPKGSRLITASQHDSATGLAISKFEMANGVYEHQETVYSNTPMQDISVAQSFAGTSEIVWSYAVTAGQKRGANSTSSGNLLLEVWSLNGSSESVGQTFNYNLFQENLENALSGNVLGYAYALNTPGTFRSGVFGDAVRAGDLDDANDSIPWTVDRRMNANSVAKTITAVATLQLLRKNGLAITSSIGPWLPSEWDPDPDASALRFVDLLKHETGYDSNDAYPTWDNLQTRFERGPNLSSTDFDYNNSNYALLRVIIPALWKNADFPELEVTEETHDDLYIIYVNNFIFKPLGISWAECRALPSEDNPTLWYDFNNPTTPGFAGGNWNPGCGSGGWWLSVRELVDFLYGIDNYPYLLTVEDSNLMKSNYLGWMDPANYSNLSVDDLYFVHGGDLWVDGPIDTGREGHSCVVKLPGNMQVALHINSSINTTMAYQCWVLVDAYENALVNQ